MNPNHESTIKQAIKLLQSLTTGGSSHAPSSSSSGSTSIPEFDQVVAEFEAKGRSLQPEMQKLTGIVIAAVNTMKQIMEYSNICPKYSSSEEQKLKNIFVGLSKETENIEKASRDYVDQCKAIREIVSATFWVFVPTPEFIVKGSVQGADFNAIKFQRKKNLDHNDWWAKISAAGKTLEKFVVKNYPQGLNFNKNGSNKWSQIISSPSNPDSLLKGDNHHSQSKPQQSHSQKGGTSAPKKPKKQMVGQNYEVRNFENENLSITSKEIQMKNGIFIENSSNCHIKIQEKFKSLNINKCQNITLFVKSCVSGIEVMNCKNITVIVKEKTPSISVDKTERAKIILNQNYLQTDIVSCKASELNLCYESDKGQESKAYLVSDQLITKWNPKAKKFETTIYDTFL